MTDGCYVAGEIYHSILSQNVSVGLDAQVKDSIIMANAKIGSSCSIEYAIIGEGAQIADGEMVIGTKDQIAVGGFGVELGGVKANGQQ